MNNVFLNPAYFDPTTLLGVGFAMHIEALVEYLKANWYLPGQAAPYAAAVISAIAQVGICVYFHVPLTAAMIGTIATTASSCWYHELTK